jgi:hypothetical protein
MGLLNLQHVPLLQLQRELYDLPRDATRFDAYLRTMCYHCTNKDGMRPTVITPTSRSSHRSYDDVRYPPLVYLNPMGRSHVSERLDELLSLRAEEIAQEALVEAQERLAILFPVTDKLTLQHGITIMDDIGGGWTDRYATDYTQRFQGDHHLSRQWLSTCWLASSSLSSFSVATTTTTVGDGANSASPSATTAIQTPGTTTTMEETIRHEVLSTAYRGIYKIQHGIPKTLHEHMICHGRSEVFAKIPSSKYHQILSDPEELVYTQAVLEPLRNTTIDSSKILVALYGDEAADALGYARLGLSAFAGFALSYWEAHHHHPHRPKLLN